MFPNESYEAQRFFQYDYIYFDLFVLLIWLFIFVKNREFKPLIFGIIIAPIIYFIDANLWWNTSAGLGFPVGTYIREYWIGGIQVPHIGGEYMNLKFGADFMMAVSYALFIFPWMCIAIRNLQQGNLFSSQVIKYSLFWFFLWIMIPLLSSIIGLNDISVVAIRHMQTQFNGAILNVIIAYSILLIVYFKEPKKVLNIFLIGLFGAIVMELPLWLFKIRPTSLLFVFFEGIFLLNQGVPWVFLFQDKIIYLLNKKLGNRDYINKSNV